jgi:putative ABC transport system permease protein
MGASPASVVWLLLRQGMFPIVIGLAAGLAASVVLGKVIRSSLFDVVSYDPWTFAAAAILLLTVGLLACFFPAQRATGMNPLKALRYGYSRDCWPLQGML